MSDDAKRGKTLNEEMVAVKQKWGAQIKLGKAEKGTPGAPFPVTCMRTIPCPPHCSMWDVEKLQIRLSILSFATGNVSVEVIGPIPKALQKKAASHLEQIWKHMQDKSAARFCLDEIFTEAETNFRSLLNLCKEMVEMYEGVDDQGLTCRRFCVVEPPNTETEEEKEKREQEEAEEKAKAALYWENKKLEEARKAEIAYQQHCQERRAEAELEGPAVRLETYAEAEARLKAKREDRSRMAKTGQKKKKFDAEGSDKVRKLKNGLLH